MPSFVTSPPGFRQFTSSDQTITAAGALTIAHGLGVIPDSIETFLICQTAELGYSIGDVVPIESGWGQSTNSVGQSIVIDATNINVRIGANAGSFYLTNKTTGATNAAITNANWRLRYKAYA